MIFLDKKIQISDIIAQKELKATIQNPAFLSIIFHAIIFSLIFGFVVGKNSNSFEFTKLNVISFSDFKEIQQNKKVSAVKAKKEAKQNQVAKAELGEIANQESKSSENSENQAAQYNSYVNAIASELERRKSRFSMSMAPENVKTVVIFTVKIDENGELVNYKLAKNSGHDFFDKIATKILTCKKNFPVPPYEISAMNLEFSIPIIFDSFA